MPHRGHSTAGGAPRGGGGARRPGGPAPARGPAAGPRAPPRRAPPDTTATEAEVARINRALGLDQPVYVQ
ncbi:hypothetical protein ACFV3T_27825, partial [Streptomyces albidoflavus]